MIFPNRANLITAIILLSLNGTASAASQVNNTVQKFSKLDRKPASSDKAADDARAVLLKLISLQKGDPRLFTASIPELANHRYWEISELALSFLKEELNKSLPNTFVLNALLPTIGRLGGDAGQISEFNRLHSLAYSELPGKIGKSSSYVVAEFDKAASGMTRPVANPRLPAAETFTEWAAVQGFKSLVSGTEKSLTDAVKKSVRDQTWVPVLGRDSETTAGLDVLVRIKGRVPTFMGEAGVGKTDVAKGIAYRILMGELPDGIHKSELNGAVILLTSASRIAKLAKSNDDNSMAEAIETYLGEVKAAEKKFGKPVIVFIDEAHTLSKGQLNGLKPLIESDDPVRLIFATTGKEMGTSLAKDDAIMRRIEPILVEELTPELTADILRKSWVPVIEKKYNTKISDELLKLVISTAPNYRPNVRRPEGPIKLLQDLAIQESRLHNGALTEPGQKDLFGFLKEKLGMPVMVEDRPAFVAFIENLKVDLRKKVIGQGEMIDGLVDTFASGISRSGGRQHASVVILGTTGVGKTMIAEQIGEKFYGSKNRILEIDMTAYMDGGYSMNALFGAPNGVISSDKDKGILCEFFEGRGKGGGVLILNEVEKAHPDAWKRFMEMLDRGEITGGDGKVRKIGRTLIVMTTNKGALNFFPREVMQGISRADLDRRIRGIDKQKLKDAFMQKESYSQTANTVPPEVVQRVDDWILASPLLSEEALIIVKNEVETFKAEQLKLGIKLEVTDRFVHTLVSSTFNEAEGARQVNRQLRTFLDKATNLFIGKHGITPITIDAEAPPMNPTQSVVTVSDGTHQVKIEGPKVVVINPMRDPVVRERLKNLDVNLETMVIDQKDAVTKVAQSIRNAASSPTNKAPASAYLLGRTGTGKTELAKAVAKYRYGNEKAICLISMGNVQSEYEMNDVFSPPKGVLGSDTKGQLEQFLNDYSEGVIVFDEMSNAGGADRKLKEAIAKKMYPILDEGTWSSPSKTYADLNRYTILFTGNDGEKLFEGISDDDLLHATWKSLTDDPKGVRDLLKESGFPEAFLGRVKSVVMMKPPSIASKTKIAEKLLKSWKTNFEKTQPIKVFYPETFAGDVAKLMYTSSQGARSMRNFIDTTLGSMASQALFDLDWDALDHQAAELHLSVESISPANPFYWLKPDQKKAVLKVTSVQGGKIVYEGTSDFTSEAEFISQIRLVDAVGTAFHEAGHALMNDPKVSGKVLDHLTIKPSGKHLGYARYVPIPGHVTNMTRATLVKDVAIKLAGTVAEQLIGREPNTGVGGDYEQSRDLIKRVALKGGLIPGISGALTDAQGEIVMNGKMHSAYDQFAEGVIIEATSMANAHLTAHWNEMVDVSRTLIQKGSISGKDYRAVVADAALKKRHYPYRPEMLKRALRRLDTHCTNLLMNESLE